MERTYQRCSCLIIDDRAIDRLAPKLRQRRRRRLFAAAGSDTPDEMALAGRQRRLRQWLI